MKSKTAMPLRLAAVAVALIAMMNAPSANEPVSYEHNQYTFFVPYTSRDDNGIAKVIGIDCDDALANAQELIDPSYLIIGDCIGDTDAELMLLESSTDWL